MIATRKIIHCDCDCFYASIEMRDNPALRELPVAVGGLPDQRGVVATCNYVARGFGIHSAMSAATARKLCPELIIIRPDMEKYRRASQRIMQIFRQYTDIIEPLSLDEAYLDVSAATRFNGDPWHIASAIRREITQQIGITVSAGIAPNKFLAKIASDWRKPDGQFAIDEADVADFLQDLPVRRLPGVGKVTAAQLQALGLQTCGDVRRRSAKDLQDLLGSLGPRLHQLSHGLDERPVQTARIRKSLSVENTFINDLPDCDACLSALPELLESLQQRWAPIADRYAICKQFVKIKFNNFLSTTVERVSGDTDMKNYQELLAEGFPRGNRPVRLLGVGVRLQPRLQPMSQDSAISIQRRQLALGLE
ncbi:MAG: hypothetical protein RLZZ385_927 [Pseudomonadota bacterium]|jgi:DNA polymerase-4